MPARAAFFLAISICASSAAPAFEGQISVALTRNGDSKQLEYTVTTNRMRIEYAGNERPDARDVINLDTGAVTILFPHNRTFMRLNASGANPAANASLTDGAYVANRFRIVQSRRHTA